MTLRHVPLWAHAEDGLGVRVGHRRDPDLVPPAIARCLTGPDSPALTDDPAQDLLALEARFRGDIAAAAEDLAAAERLIQMRRRAAAAGPRWSLAARNRRRQARQDFDAARAQHAAASAAVAHHRRQQRVLREFVIGLNLRSGLLAEAACGWCRSPDAPGTAVVFADEAAFLSGDSRRGDDMFGHRSPDAPGTAVVFADEAAFLSGDSRREDDTFGFLTGDEFGRQWRRDPDEDAAAALERAGTWTLLYLARTGEICATRRGGQVWLLGTGFHDPVAAHTLLTDLEPRMREPNSLVLAAQRVHAARPLRAPSALIPRRRDRPLRPPARPLTVRPPV
uniref:hypothetical protein n=1 Tax=Amycolatopsis sp. CA-096443 TaxID=3239919 RepID=UPI003F49458E